MFYKHVYLKNSDILDIRLLDSDHHINLYFSCSMINMRRLFVNLTEEKSYLSLLQPSFLYVLNGALNIVFCQFFASSIMNLAYSDMCLFLIFDALAQCFLFGFADN